MLINLLPLGIILRHGRDLINGIHDLVHGLGQLQRIDLRQVADLDLVLAEQCLERHVDHTNVVLPLKQRRDRTVKVQHPVDGDHLRADINRATFYAHYPNVRGVTEEIENEIIAKMLDVLKEFQFTNFFRNPAPLLLKLSRYLEEDAEFYRTLIRASGSEIFMEKLKRCFTDYMLNGSDIPEDMRHSKMVSLRVCYFSGGIVNLYKQWFRGDLDCTLNDIALEVSKLLQLEAQELFGTR